MKYRQVLTRCVLLAGLFLLGLSVVSQAQAREIWLNPTEAAKKPLGNWGAVPLKRSVHFNWQVPADFDASASGQTGTGSILIIGLKDQDISYRINVSVAGVGEMHDVLQNTATVLKNTEVVTLLAVPAGFLTEIPITDALPPLSPGDYVAVSLEKASKVKVLVVGMRYEYEDFNAELVALQAQVAALPDASSLLTTFAGVTRTGNDIFFDSVNVHIRNGLGSTDGDPNPNDMNFDPNVNSLGNLIVGYDEARGVGNDKTGSHNLVVGPQHNYPSYGGLVAGLRNTVADGYSSVSGGSGNIADGLQSSVSGGTGNTASGSNSSVSAGFGNIASGFTSSVSGGLTNTASSLQSSVSGGANNTASGDRSSVSGGSGNTASGTRSSVSGGASNTASGNESSVSGGRINVATGLQSSVSGGQSNLASGTLSSVSGGDHNTASGQRSSVSGGQGNTASSFDSSVSGGLINTASGSTSSVSGGGGNTASGQQSSVSGGLSNLAGIGQYSTVSGGQGNTASHDFSTVSGGNGVTTTGVDDWAAGP